MIPQETTARWTNGENREYRLGEATIWEDITRQWIIERERERERGGTQEDSSHVYVHVGVAKISVLLVCTTKSTDRTLDIFPSKKIKDNWLAGLWTLINGFCFRRKAWRCFSIFINALLRLKKTFWHSRIRSFKWVIRSSPAKLLSEREKSIRRLRLFASRCFTHSSQENCID